MAKSIIMQNICPMALGKITTKTLIDQLRELEKQKIIKRIVYPEVPPKVEYSLSEIGKTIQPVLKSLCDWGTQYLHLLGYESNEN